MSVSRSPGFFLLGTTILPSKGYQAAPLQLQVSRSRLVLPAASPWLLSCFFLTLKPSSATPVVRWLACGSLDGRSLTYPPCARSSFHADAIVRSCHGSPTRRPGRTASLPPSSRPLSRGEEFSCYLELISFAGSAFIRSAENCLAFAYVFSCHCRCGRRPAPSALRNRNPPCPANAFTSAPTAAAQ